MTSFQNEYRLQAFNKVFARWWSWQLFEFANASWVYPKQKLWQQKSKKWVPSKDKINLFLEDVESTSHCESYANNLSLAEIFSMRIGHMIYEEWMLIALVNVLPIFRRNVVLLKQSQVIFFEIQSFIRRLRNN